MSINWKITPEQFLKECGEKIQKKGSWGRLKYCPFCRGGDHSDILTFAFHLKDGNYTCLRTKCSEKGNFWKLIERFGRSPRDYVEKFSKSKKPKKKFVYNRKK